MEKAGPQVSFWLLPKGTNNLALYKAKIAASAAKEPQEILLNVYQKGLEFDFAVSRNGFDLAGSI